MKTFSRIMVTLPLIAGLASLPALLPASEARVSATGGLVTVLPDETADLNLFLDGNPAGLVLLNSRSRLDLSGNWFSSDQEGPWGVSRVQGLGFLTGPGGPNAAYEGLLFFPSSHWAFQTTGDLSTTEGIPTTGNGSSTLAENQYRGLARAAYAFSFGAVGMEILDTQSDLQYSPGGYNASLNLTGGSSGQNQLLVKTGIALFPSPAGPDQPRWQVGGFFAFPAAAGTARQTLNLSEGGSAPFLVNQTTTETLFNTSGLELLYEVPASLKVHFSADLQNTSSDFEQTTSAPSSLFNDLPRFHLSDSQYLNLEGAFRYSIPLEGEQNLKLGGSLGLLSSQTQSQATGIQDSFHQQQVSFLFGIGLAEEKEYTMGLQWKSRTMLGGGRIEATVPGTLDDNNDLIQLAFGGEKWLSPTWAMRLGLVLEEDDSNAQAFSALTTSINAGVGWEQAFGRMDLRLNLGQTLDNGNSSNTIGLLGAQCSTTIFL